MLTHDIFKFSLSNIRHRKLRSWLTILGIVIGVATVIALVSIGQGLRQSINRQLSGFGGNLIFISPGNPRASNSFGFNQGPPGLRSTTIISLKESDVTAIKTVPGVQYVSGTISGQAEIQFKGQKASTSIQGVEPGVWELIQVSDLEKGRFLRHGDSNSVLIGNRISHDLFDKEVRLNDQLEINNKIFRVVGILKSGGGLIGGITDSIVIVTKDGAKNVLENGFSSGEITSIIVKTTDTADPNVVAKEITNKLRIVHHVNEQNQDFTVASPEVIQERISMITNTVTLFLGGIATISLIVGGVGIANTMFTSVSERTRLIGVLKSIGMTNGEIMKVFLIESALMGLIGGVIGSVIGFGASKVISGFVFSGPGGAGVSTYVSSSMVILVIVFSIAVGAVSGIFPARRASKLQPIEALRYE